MPAPLFCILHQSQHFTDILLAKCNMLIIYDNTWNGLDVVPVYNILKTYHIKYLRSAIVRKNCQPHILQVIVIIT